MSNAQWPDVLIKPGEALVSSDPVRWHLNACIGTQLDDQSGLVWYTDGFKQAARQLVDEFVNNGQRADYPIDTVVYPIVFLYRHHFELLLKLLLRDSNLANGGNGDYPIGHKLGPLWEDLRVVIEGMFTTADWSQNDAVSDLFKQFDVVDPKAQTARYPINRNGVKSFDKISLLNIEHFADVAERLSSYLEMVGTAIEERLPQ